MKLDVKLAVATGGIVGFLLMVRDAFKKKDTIDLEEIRRQATLLAAVQRASDEALRKAALPVTPVTPFTPVSPPTIPVTPPMLRQLTSDPLSPIPGRRYYVTITLGPMTALMAGASAVKEQAKDHGFTDVGVSKNKPAGWPGSSSGSYYVTGRYVGIPTSLERSYLLGGVKITDVWEEG